MKEKIKRLTKKKWFAVTAALIVLALILYGAGRLVFAEDYGIVRWDGNFQYSQDNWKYSTKSYIIVNGNEEKLYANKGNGFTRRDSDTGNTKILEVNQTELVQYLQDEKGYEFKVGDKIEWYADAEVTFKYSGVVTTSRGPYDTVDEAYEMNEQDWTKARESIEGRGSERGVLVDWPDDNIGGICIIQEDRTNPTWVWYGYLHHYQDGGYWRELCEENYFPIKPEHLNEKSKIDIYFQDEYGSNIATRKGGTGTVGSPFSYTAESTIESDGNIYTLDSWVYESEEDSGSGTGSTAEFELKSTSYTLTFTYVMKELPPEHVCTYEWGNYNSEYHWYVCSECGRSSTKHAHQMVAGDTDPDTGETEYTCECSSHDECPYSYVKHTHSYVGWLPDADDYPMEDGEWEEWYEYNPNKYHWKYCEYDDCSSTSGKASHSGTGYEDEGDGYERNRCKTCGWILGERPVTVNIYLNPNGGVFPDGSTEMIEIGPFTYGQVTNLSVLQDEKYFPTMEGKEFFGYYVVEEGLSEAFYKPNWELGILEGQPYFFGTNSNGEAYSKVKKAYTIHAQYKEPSYDIEYHPTNDLANPPTMAKSYHKVGVPSNLSPIGFYVTIPIKYDLGTVAGNVEVTVDQSFHEAKFLGWATSEERALAGIVDYEDKAEVTDLLTHAGTFHLYAVWDYGSIVLPNAKSANGGMKLEGWTNHDGDYYKVLNDFGNFAGNVECPLSGKAEILTAKWIPNTYTVSFNSNGGTECSPITVEYLGKYGKLPEPKRSGYTFAGWEDDITKTIVTEITTVTLAANHTLNAKWNPNPITITLEYCFDSVGNPANPKKYALPAEEAALTVKDSDTDTYSTYYNEFYNSLPTPSMDGYTFVGWYLEKADGTGCGHDTCLRSNMMRIDTAGDHTLYARWTENRYKINLDTNDAYSVWGKD